MYHSLTVTVVLINTRTGVPLFLLHYQVVLNMQERQKPFSSYDWYVNFHIPGPHDQVRLYHGQDSA